MHLSYLFLENSQDQAVIDILKQVDWEINITFLNHNPITRRYFSNLVEGTLSTLNDIINELINKKAKPDDIHIIHMSTHINKTNKLHQQLRDIYFPNEPKYEPSFHDEDEFEHEESRDFRIAVSRNRLGGGGWQLLYLFNSDPGLNSTPPAIKQYLDELSDRTLKTIKERL